MRQGNAVIQGQGAGAPVYLVTNQVNLREALASGLLGPRSSFRNYAEDFLALRPGVIPLFSGAVTPDMVEFVRRHHPATTMPVVLEIDFGPGELNDIRTLELHAGAAGRARLCYAYSRVIGIRDRLKAIHFLSEDDLNEFRVRAFRDLPDYTDLLRSTPALLQAGGSTVDQVAAWLETIPSPPTPHKSSFTAYDRVSGACLLAYEFTPKPARDELRRLVNRYSTDERPNLPTWLAGGLFPENQRPASVIDENEVLFAACVLALHRIDQPVSTGLPLLEMVEAEFASHQLQNTTSFDILRKARLYLRNEAPFTPLKTSRFVVAGALLLFLMRPDAERLLNWPREETGATDEVMQTAMVFAGLLKGRKGLDTKLRNRQLNDPVEQWIVRSLNDEITAASAGGSEKATSQTAAPVTRNGVGETEGQSAQLPDTGAENQLSPPVIPAVPDQIAGIKSEAGKSPRPRASRSAAGKNAASQQNASEQMRALLLAADLSSPRMREAALALSRKLNWNNCVRSVVTIPLDEESSFSPLMRVRAKGAVLAMPGIAVVEYELLDDRFRENLSALKPATVKWRQAAADLAALLTAAESPGDAPAAADSSRQDTPEPGLLL